MGAVVYGQTSGHKLSLTKIAEGFGSSVANLFSPKNTNAAIYSLLSAGLGVYSLVLLFGSHEVHSQSHLSTAAPSLLCLLVSCAPTAPLSPCLLPLLPAPSLPPPLPCATLSVLPMFSCSAPGSTYLPLARPLLLSLYVLATLMQLPLDGSMTNFILCQLFLDWLYALFTLYMKLLCSRSEVTKLCVCVCVMSSSTTRSTFQQALCLSVQLAAQWLVIGNDQVSLYLQREIGLSTFLAAIQTYCLKVNQHTLAGCCRSPKFIDHYTVLCC